MLPTNTTSTPFLRCPALASIWYAAIVLCRLSADKSWVLILVGLPTFYIGWALTIIVVNGFIVAFVRP